MHFDIDATRKTNLVNGWDEIGLTLRHKDEIEASIELADVLSEVLHA